VGGARPGFLYGVGTCRPAGPYLPRLATRQNGRLGILGHPSGRPVGPRAHHWLRARSGQARRNKSGHIPPRGRGRGRDSELSRERNGTRGQHVPRSPWRTTGEKAPHGSIQPPPYVPGHPARYHAEKFGLRCAAATMGLGSSGPPLGPGGLRGRTGRLGVSNFVPHSSPHLVETFPREAGERGGPPGSRRGARGQRYLWQLEGGCTESNLRGQRDGRRRRGPLQLCMPGLGRSARAPVQPGAHAPPWLKSHPPGG